MYDTYLHNRYIEIYYTLYIVTEQNQIDMYCLAGLEKTMSNAYCYLTSMKY